MWYDYEYYMWTWQQTNLSSCCFPLRPTCLPVAVLNSVLWFYHCRTDRIMMKGLILIPTCMNIVVCVSVSSFVLTVKIVQAALKSLLLFQVCTLCWMKFRHPSLVMRYIFHFDLVYCPSLIGILTCRYRNIIEFILNPKVPRYQMYY